MGWIFDFYKQKFEEGKRQGKEIKKKHKKKVKKLFKKEDDENVDGV